MGWQDKVDSGAFGEAVFAQIKPECINLWEKSPLWMLSSGASKEMDRFSAPPDNDIMYREAYLQNEVFRGYRIAEYYSASEDAVCHLTDYEPTSSNT